MMTKKVKTAKNILVIYDYSDNYDFIPVQYLCPTCLNEVKNKNQICKYCNEELKEKK